jgi:hypothetical protein
MKFLLQGCSCCLSGRRLRGQAGARKLATDGTTKSFLFHLLTNHFNENGRNCAICDWTPSEGRRLIGQHLNRVQGEWSTACRKFVTFGVETIRAFEHQYPEIRYAVGEQDE